MKRFILLTIFVLDCISVFAQTATDADTLAVERRSNRNVLLNASSDSQPRVISLGIPQWDLPILDDGLPTAMYNDFFPGFWSWRSGLGTESLQLTMLDESALELGDIGFYAMTSSKTGADDFEGAVKYPISNHGRQQLDLNLASPIGRGWGFNLNLYQDLNRGPNHLELSYLQEHIQHYLVANYMIDSRWGLELNAIETRQHAELWQYGEADLPTPKPKMNYIVRGGVDFKNNFLDFQSLLMFYQRDNNFYTALWTHELDRPVNGYPAGYKESVYVGSLHSMRVLAWTTDFILTPFKGFRACF